MTHHAAFAELLLGACLLASSAAANDMPPVPVRVGSHPGYGRIVFDLPSRTDYTMTQQGQHVVIHFPAGMAIGRAPGMPRNVLSLTDSAGEAELDVVPNASVHDWRLGSHVVIDVMDPSGPVAGAAAAPPPVSTPASTAPAATPTTEATPPSNTAAKAPEVPAPLPAATPDTTKPTEAVPPAPQPDQPATAAPQPASETPPTAPANTDVAQDQPAPTALIVPFESPLGVAAFHRADAVIVVFDRPIPIDLKPLHDDAVFGAATSQTTPAATVVRVPLQSGSAVAVIRENKSWRVEAAAAEKRPKAIPASIVDGQVVLPAAAPGNVVAIVDPENGGTLLVGTQQHDGQGVAVYRRSAEFALLPTLQGVVVEPSADSVTLRPSQDGFVLRGEPSALALSPAPDMAEQLAHSAGLTRRFDFPSQSSATLMEQLQRQVADDASTPSLARGPRRMAIARTMIALGLGPEAQAMLQMAATDDPELAGSPDAAALAAIAALLASRPHDATGLDDKRLRETDDIALWRAIRQTALEQNRAGAAATIAASLPLLLAYPPGMRDRVLPQAAETLVGGGQTEAAAALLDARKGDATLDLARGMLQQAKGDTAGALMTYDRLAQSADRSVHARAAVRAVELRLASGAIGAKDAADRLDKLLYAWRGDRRELSLRQRLADLRAQTGSWRAALGLLRENEALFRDDKDTLHAKLADMFAAFLRGNAADTLAPLELVSLVDENTDLLPDGAEGEALEARLADRLLALDLPKQAEPVLAKLMQAAPTGVGRANFGARLAALRLHEGDATGSIAALSDSDMAGLPAELAERRELLLAGAEARRGNEKQAMSVLGSMHSAAADEARATILERDNDWSGAKNALTDFVGKTVPADGPLDDGQRRSLLRLATAAARAGDAGMLDDMRQRNMARMGSGPLADMFRLLTAAQVRTSGDLKRSGQEATLAGALPNALKALQQPVRTP